MKGRSVSLSDQDKIIQYLQDLVADLEEEYGVVIRWNVDEILSK